MKVATELAKEAKSKGICEDWHEELKTLDDKKDMIAMYLKGIDFCLSNDYPSNDYIRANFKGVMEEFGVFLDDEISLINREKCVALGSTKGRVEVNEFAVCEVFVKHNSELTINADDDAFVMVDIFDNTVLHVKVDGRAKVCVNRYGSSRIANIDKSDSAMVKVIEKHKKTY